MTSPLPLLSDDEVRPRGLDREEAGFGALKTERGLLPLKAMEVRGRLDGLLAQVSLRQTFVNVLDEPIEATYIFPLPDRAAVTRFRMEVAGRVVDGVLEERARARRVYDEAIAAGHRASIAEEERPGVFTMRVGNLAPGEQAVIELTLAGPLPFDDGEVTFRFPLVVAPRYIPGTPLPGPSVGEGAALDTDSVPDASRISPPVLLPGFPNPVRLAFSIDVHESVVTVGAIRSSLHAVVEEAEAGYRRISIQPGERLNRDVILRYRLGSEAISTALSVHPDPKGEGREGTFALTLVPPSLPDSPAPSRPRDVVFVLDRSGSMDGWKMVAARRALARLVDTLGGNDRFQVLAFDTCVESPTGFPAAALVAATDRQRFRAVEFLAGIEARGGTEMADPLDRAVTLLGEAESSRDRVLVLVTDGQVGNEDQIVRALAPRVRGVRIFALGIDRAVNEAFLRRLAGLGEGSCDVVESEERLDEVMDAAHRRIGSPVLTALRLEPEGLPLVADSLVPERLPDLFATAPVLILGRYQGTFPSQVTLSGRDAAGDPWSQSIAATVRDNPAVASVWARGQVRKLEDRYVAGQGDRNELETRIVATSLGFGVLCRFTAFVAVDRSEVVNAGGDVHRVTQPVELPEGWAPSRGVVRDSRSMMSPEMSEYRSVRQAPKMRMSRGRPSPGDAVLFSAPSELPCAPPPCAAPEDSGVMAYSPPPPPSAPPAGLSEIFQRFWASIAGHRHEPGSGPAEIRAKALELLAELRTAQGTGEAALLLALRGLTQKLKELRKELKALGGEPAALAAIQSLIDAIGLLRKANPPAADELRRLGSKAESLLAALAGEPASDGNANRQNFWK